MYMYNLISDKQCHAIIFLVYIAVIYIVNIYIPTKYYIHVCQKHFVKMYFISTVVSSCQENLYIVIFNISFNFVL